MRPHVSDRQIHGNKAAVAFEEACRPPKKDHLSDKPFILGGSVDLYSKSS